MAQLSISRTSNHVEGLYSGGITVEYLIFKSPSALAIRGAIAIILGIVALLLPGPTFLVLTIAFGVFALIDGISALMTLFDRNTRMSRGWLALEALAGIIVGIITMGWPGIAALNLILLIAAWALVTGVIKIAAAIALRKQIRREWLLVLSGVVSIIFGGLLIWRPLLGIVSLVWALGIFGLVYGALMVSFAVRMRRWDDLFEKAMPGAA